MKRSGKRVVGARSPSERIVAAFAVVTLAGLLLLLGEDWTFGTAAATDTLLLTGLRRIADQPGLGWILLRRAAGIITDAGAFPTLVVVIAGAVLILDKWRLRAVALRFASAVGLGIAATNLLKIIVARPRPEVVPHWAAVTSMSFPSGHSADSAVVYLLLALVADRTVTSPAIRYGVTVAAIVLVLLVGSTRLYLGVHWPTDVLAGWCFGATWALAVRPLLQRPDKRPT